jgi:hypothetical protein
MATALVEARFGQGYQLTGTSVFWMCRSFGCGLHAAFAMQIVAAALATIATYRVWRMPGDPLPRVSLTMFLTFFILPYGFSADMVGYSIGLAILAQQRQWKVSLLDGLLWLAPGYTALLTASTGALLTPCIVGIAVFTGRRALYRPASDF